MARPTVVLELAGSHKLARDLVAGGVFVPGCTVGFNEDCELLVRAGDVELRVSARVVWVDGTRGAGLQLIDCDATTRQQLGELAQQMAEPPAAEPPAAVASEPQVTDAELELELERTALVDGELELELEPEHGELDAGSAFARAAMPVPEPSPAAPPPEETEAAAEETEDERKVAHNIHERLRGLTLAQQLKLAHHGEVQERIVLERLYSKNVWEALLRNPRLTGPEVARIGRMGSLPRIHLEIILNNGGWLQIPEVRRALLSNPRLGVDQIMRVLRLMPKHELKLAMMQTAYPHAVRDAARKLIG